MEFLWDIIRLLQAEMPEPHSYGWLHFLWVLIIGAFTVFLCVRFKNSPDSVVRKISLIVAIVLIIFDIYKQITFDGNLSYSFEEGTFMFDYSWHAFPFQLCSTPHYVLPFIIFLKDSRLRDCFIGYMIFFSLVGGLCVFVYPEDCLVSTIGVNIQTMLHHGMQISLAFLYAVHERKKINIKYFLRSIPVFVTFVSIALGLNLLVNEIFLAKGVVGAEGFNMFYIGPIVDCSLPVLNIIYPLLPYPVFLALYIFGFIFLGFLLYLLFRFILSSCYKKRGKDTPV